MPQLSWLADKCQTEIRGNTNHYRTGLGAQVRIVPRLLSDADAASYIPAVRNSSLCSGMTTTNVLDARHQLGVLGDAPMVGSPKTCGNNRTNKCVWDTP